MVSALTVWYRLVSCGLCTDRLVPSGLVWSLLTVWYRLVSCGLCTDRLVPAGFVGDDEECFDAVLSEVGVPEASVAGLHAVRSVQTIQRLLGDVDSSAGQKTVNAVRYRQSPGNGNAHCTGINQSTLVAREVQCGILYRLLLH